MSSSRPLGSIPLPPAMRGSLLAAGFETQQDVLELDPADLAGELGVAPEEALAVRKAVQNLGQSSPLLEDPGEAAGKSALDLLVAKRGRQPVFTLNADLDALLGGGVARGEVTEFCGVPGVGKTQLAMQLAVDAQIPRAFGGPGGEAVVVDTEGSFLPERLCQVAQGLANHLRAVARASPEAANRTLADGVTAESLLSGVHCYRVYDHVEQLGCVRQLGAFLAERPRVRLLVVDSVAFHFRRGFTDMALRARLLTGMAQELLKLAERYDLAVVLVNQVTTRLGDGGGDGGGNGGGGEEQSVSRLVPALGESWAHACTNRVMLHWQGGRRTATVIKSPSRSQGSATYVVTEAGFRGLPSSASSSTSSSPPAAAAAAGDKRKAADSQY